MSKYDWTNVPSEVEWIATDSNGMKCYYSGEQPFYDTGLGEWFVNFSSKIIDYLPSEFTGYWKESLEERPK